MTLKVDVLFGSTSDEPVYRQLTNMLSDMGISYRMEVCSAHRNPDRLRDLVKSSDADVFIAGAGLSAHLPGAVAAHSLKPVIGLPCNDVMKGLDALIACMQMPSGVPVLASGIENLNAIKTFLSHYTIIKDNTNPCIGIYAPATADKLVQSTIDMLKPYPFSIDSRPEGPQDEDIVIYFVNLLEPSEKMKWTRPDALYVPYLPEDKPWDPRILNELTQQGGLWVGINTYKNAVIALVELWNRDGQWNQKLQEFRGGVPAHV